MDILPLQLKLNNFYYEIHDYNKVGRIIYIENSDDEFFQTIRKIWNKITKLIGINNAPNFVQSNLMNNILGPIYLEIKILLKAIA